MSTLFAGLIILFAMFSLGGFTSYVASEKGYSAGSWFWLGFLFPIIGFLASVGLPVKNQP